MNAQKKLPLTWDTNPRQRLNASGGSQPRNDEGASHFARRGKNAEAFLINHLKTGIVIETETCYNVNVGH
jgi:hypothetical protein